VIGALALFWYGLVPVAGAFVSRRRWRIFRRRFDGLRLEPLLDYAAYCQGREGPYRFLGGFESVTDGHTLWIRGETLTIPVSLTGAHTYVLPLPKSGDIPAAFDPAEEAPERIRWDRVAALTEGAKVFIGGLLLMRDNRLTFTSTRESPLLVIFYDGSDRSLTARVIRAGRHRNEYWNPVTPYALILGASCQLIIAVSFLSRPAFRLTVITAVAAAFTPLFPLVPPGIVCTLLYRRLWWRARIFRAYRDLAGLPLKYLFPDKNSIPKSYSFPQVIEGKLPGGERYALVYRSEQPLEEIPALIPEHTSTRKEQGWYICGGFPKAAAQDTIIPDEPEDVFATYGVLPGRPDVLARRFNIQAYFLEIIAWLVLLFGIGLNAFFIGMIITLLS
jgi:hypothetical protein